MKSTAHQHRSGTRTAFGSFVVATLLLAGCKSVGPDYEAPIAAVPPEWRETGDPAFAAGAPVLTEWWRAMGDPTLDRLIARTVEQGPELREAIARLREARTLRGVAGSERFPTLGAAGSYARSGTSEFMLPATPTADAHLYVAGLDATWELDLWGRVRRSVEAADAELAAAVEDARGVALAVVAETAVNYVELRAFQQRLALARTNVRLQEETLALVRARCDAGLVGERDLAQAATNVAVTRARVPALETGARAAENRLATLLGLAPGTLAGELETARAIPVPPPSAAVGMPADLLRHRPDVRRAERRAAAEHARIGVAVGDRYPRFALSGSLGVAAGEASDLFHSGSDTFGLGPSVRWTLFDGARLRQRVAAQNARAEQALVRWERTVLVALEEAETTMTAFMREQTRRHDLLDAAVQARRAVVLAQVEYREGKSDFQAVLDSERALAGLEDELAQTDAAIATHFVALHKALGSG